MRDEMKEALLLTIRNHPAIVEAAIVGSVAGRTYVDQFSDLDILLIADDIEAVSDVRRWLPASMRPLICATHLSRYCTVLFDDFQKLDAAIFAVEEDPTNWVVQQWQIVKGGDDFATKLCRAAQHTRERLAAHLNPDVSVDNVLLLIFGTLSRARRRELASAHSLLSMACDMLVALESQRTGVGESADLLDVRRRLEQWNPALAGVIHGCLFDRPDAGAVHLARYVATRCEGQADQSRREVLRYLLQQDADGALS